MNKQDLITSNGLGNKIERPNGPWMVPYGPKTHTVTFKNGDLARGPEGQPLATVRLPSGRLAFVDPNTNRYYLTDQRVFAANGSIKTWQIDLPPGAQFSNSHFSDADVRHIEYLAKPRVPRFPWPPPPPHPPPGGGVVIQSPESRVGGVLESKS